MFEVPVSVTSVHNFFVPSEVPIAKCYFYGFIFDIVTFVSTRHQVQVSLTYFLLRVKRLPTR